MAKIIRVLLLANAFLFLSRAIYAQEARDVRVAIMQDASSFSLKIKGQYEIQDTVSGRTISRGKNLNITVSCVNGNLALGRLKFDGSSVLVKVNPPAILAINGRRFRDSIRVFKNSGGRLMVTNIVNLEDYIKGILYHEASHYWPQEALKAQAIVSRTYALYEMEENRGKDFDVTSDIYSQVYGGLTSERARTNAAVEETNGCVLTFKGRIIPAFFSATCGGHTEDAAMLWKIDLPPLKGVPCDFCKESPHYNWHYVLSAQELAKSLVLAGYKIKDIVAVAPLGKDASGRVTDLRIASLVEEKNISANKLRNIIGPNLIRSTNFEVSVVHKDVVFEGVGWGHGVGMCQWGAYFMAKSGHTYADILHLYYPGSELTLLQ